MADEYDGKGAISFGIADDPFQGHWAAGNFDSVARHDFSPMVAHFEFRVPSFESKNGIPSTRNPKWATAKQLLEIAQFSDFRNQSAGELRSIRLPVGIKGEADFNPYLRPKFSLFVIDPHGNKGNGSPPFPAHILLKAQDPLDQSMLSRPHAIGIVSSFREEDHGFPTLQDFIDKTEGIQALNGVLPVDRDSAQEPDQMGNAPLFKKFLFGNVVKRPQRRDSDDWDIRPKLVFGEDDTRPSGGEMFPALDLQAIDESKTGISDIIDESVNDVRSSDFQEIPSR